LDTVIDAVPVSLDEVLPDASEVDQVDLAEHMPSADVLGEGSEGLSDGQVVVGVFQAPWAVDAAGQELPTSFDIDNGDLVQVVDTANADFPVVSDPLPLIGIALVGVARILAPHAIRAFATQTIRAGAAYTTRGGYASFARFKTAVGSPRPNYQWHHIVEQSNIAKRGWDAAAIHNRANLVQIPKAVHQKCVNSWMSKKGVRAFGASASSSQTMRSWVHGQSYSKQHSIGVALLRHCGLNI